MNFKAVIFDLDGTLVNSIEDIAMSMNIVLTNNNFPTFDLETYKTFIGHGVRDLVSKAIPEGYKDTASVTQFFNEMMVVYREHCVQNTSIYPGILELLEELTLKNIPLAVLSNKVDELTKKVVSHLFPTCNFIEVLGMTTEPLKKPNPHKALFIAKTLEIATKDILFVGDSEADVETALNAGMQAVGVLWGFRNETQLREAGATAILKNPLELMEL